MAYNEEPTRYPSKGTPLLTQSRNRRQKSMKLNKAFIDHNAGEESVLVPTGKAEWSGVIRGNRILGEILALLHEETTEEAVIAGMKERFDAQREPLSKTWRAHLRPCARLVRWTNSSRYAKKETGFCALGRTKACLFYWRFLRATLVFLTQPVQARRSPRQRRDTQPLLRSRHR